MKDLFTSHLSPGQSALDPFASFITGLRLAAATVAELQHPQYKRGGGNGYGTSG